MAAKSNLPLNIRSKVLGNNILKDEEVQEIFDKFATPFSNQNAADIAKLNINIEKSDKPKQKPVRRTVKRLSCKARRKLGLYYIGRKSLMYEDLLPLHSLWEDYMRNYMDIKKLSAKRYGDISTEQDSNKLFRADYHGAIITVSSSSCPDYVGHTGIVAMETKNCFRIVGKDNITRTIPKINCEFHFEIDHLRFSFFGKNFISRPADRSSKKIKTVHHPFYNM